MQFQYRCDGKNATATTYSYLKEPRIEETGYTRGLKSSSFNYLENGTIELEENIRYFYGNGTNITNASVEHSMKVDFDGKRGYPNSLPRASSQIIDGFLPGKRSDTKKAPILGPSYGKTTQLMISRLTHPC